MPFEQDGNVYCRKFGNRREVLDGVAYCTSGKLTADRLEERGGKIISKKRSEMGKARYAEKNPFRPADDEKLEAPVKVKKKRQRKAITVGKKSARLTEKTVVRKITTKPVRDVPDAPSAVDVSSEPTVPRLRQRIRRRRRRGLRAIRGPRMGN